MRFFAVEIFGTSRVILDLVLDLGEVGSKNGFARTLCFSKSPHFLRSSGCPRSLWLRR